MIFPTMCSVDLNRLVVCYHLYLLGDDYDCGHASYIYMYIWNISICPEIDWPLDLINNSFHVLGSSWDCISFLYCLSNCQTFGFNTLITALVPAFR